MSKIPGDFVPLDVRYRRDRAIRSAGIAGELLYVRSLAHAKGNDTGGMVEDYDLPDLTAGMADPEGTVAALVRVGLWVEVSPESWAIRSWQKWNPSRDVSSDGRLGNHKRWHLGRGIVAPDCGFCIPSQSPDIAPESPPMSGTDIPPESSPRVGGESQIRLEKRREETPASQADADADAEPQQDAEAGHAKADAEFTTWWQHYPKKKDKGHARKAYNTARKKTDADTLLAAVKHFAQQAANADPKFIPYPGTWLNGERWGDETDPTPEDEHGDWTPATNPESFGW